MWHKINKYFNDNAHWGLLVLGIVLRLRHYLENRSLWLDEACAAVSIASRSYGEIWRHFEVMPEFAHPPMLFMLAERWLISLWGNNELALRLLPLLCGIGALLAFWALGRRWLPQRAFWAALALFALIDPLVYYAAELKQYSTDLLVMIGLLWVSEKRLGERCAGKTAVFWALVGAVVLWVSNAMIFFLAALAVLMIFEAGKQRDWKSLGWLAGVFVFWAVSFAGLYVLSLGQMVGNDKLRATWQGALFTGTLFSGEAVGWAGQVLLESFRNPVGLGWPWMGLILFAVGTWALWCSGARRCLLYVLPLVLALLAGWLGKYPFRGRVLLFLVPCYLVPIALGVETVAGWCKRFSVWAYIVLLGLLCLYPLQVAAANFVSGRDWVENRPVMEFFRDHYERGDFVVMNTSAQPPFWYYVGSLGIGVELAREPLGKLEGRLLEGMRVAKFARDIVEKDGYQLVAYRFEYHVFDAQGHFRQMLVPNPREAHFVRNDSAISGLPKGRVWLVLSKAPEDDDRQINQVIRDAFDRRARRLKVCERKNAAVYLYTF